MTPEQHYRYAEQLLARADEEKNGYLEDRLVARAHVHAILATRPLSGVTMHTPEPERGYDGIDSDAITAP